MDYNKSNCPFCFLDKKIKVIKYNDLAFVIYDIFPVSKGHCLVITKRHVSNFFDITNEEKLAILNLVDQMKNELHKKYNPDGFNLGVNINEAAGQTVPHVHFHLIPRYTGDMENPRGGVRHVIPDKGNY